MNSISKAASRLSGPTDSRGGAEHDAPVCHPIGTLVIVLLFGLAFTIGWLVIYSSAFLPHG